jgi:hypothetical protein
MGKFAAGIARNAWNTAKNAAKNAATGSWNWAKNAATSSWDWAKDHKQEIYAGLGALNGGLLGGIYGWAIGSNGGIKQYWEDHKWFRIMTYVVITAVVIAASIFLGPEAFLAGNWFLFGPTVAGTIIGGIYGGYNKGQGWNWERACKYAMIGSIIGLTVAYSFNSTQIAVNANMAEGATSLQASSLSGNAVAYGLNATFGISTVGTGTIMAIDLYSIYSIIQMIRAYNNHRSVSLPFNAFSYDFDDKEAGGWLYNDISN